MKFILTNKIKIIIYSVLVIFVVLMIFFGGNLFSKILKIVSPESREGIVSNQECVSKIEEKVVRGNSLAGLIEDGQTVKAFWGYYDCNEIKRNDLVFYNFAGSEIPLIKIIKGMPGDILALQQTENGSYILINNEILKNSENIPYLISEQGYRMLSLYEGKISERVYLILSNLPHGGTDSTRFGLVHKDDILGKAELLK